MKKHFYLICGMSPELAKEWYKDHSDIAEFFKNKKGEYVMKVSLSLFHAIWVRVGIIGYNLGKTKHRLHMTKL